MCPEGLGHLQPGAKGGPDAKKNVTCETGFSLCLAASTPKARTTTSAGTRTTASRASAGASGHGSSSLALACTEKTPPTGEAPLSIKLEIDGNALRATEAGAPHAATLDATFHSHGSPKVRYLISNGAAPFAASHGPARRRRPLRLALRRVRAREVTRKWPCSA